ncbi:DMT family transporter [Aureimonas leprariae]|uniref:EamA-like transporter family protein n=1 Tax=Plantimonas leprariae TaxID=2615207 RepID=A0A7V7PQV1_9HYPH|nr:DMT family transporter [Aureimonas leprariae]KAB0680815.1 EamA-like transporter family protein [Aureimonas leprariae]
MPTPSTSRPKPHHLLAAFCTGCLLTLMVYLNGELARFGGAMFASWTAHGVGLLAAAAFLALAFRSRRRGAGTASKAPVWACLGGLSGAATVLATSTAVNSRIGLSGTLALGLAGQALFALAADRWGLFSLPVRKPDRFDALSLVLILAGSALIILFARIA